MGLLKPKCEKCNNPIYPVYFRNEEKKFKTIFHNSVSKSLKRVYWCMKCKRFWHRYV